MMTHDEALQYIHDHYNASDIKNNPEEVGRLVGILTTQKHKPWCRRHMRKLMPSYGSDCTCGEGTEGEDDE